MSLMKELKGFDQAVQDIIDIEYEEGQKPATKADVKYIKRILVKRLHSIEFYVLYNGTVISFVPIYLLYINKMIDGFFMGLFIFVLVGNLIYNSYKYYQFIKTYGVDTV